MAYGDGEYGTTPYGGEEAASAAEVTLAGTVPAVTGAFTLDVPLSVTLAGTIPAVTGAFALDAVLDVTLAGTVPAVTGAFDLDTHSEVTLTGVIPPVTGSFDIDSTITSEVTLDGVVPPVTGAFTLDLRTEITLAGVVPPVTGAFTVGSPGEITLAGTIPPVTGSFALAPEVSVTLAGIVPAVVGTFDVLGAYEVTLTGQVPAVTGSFDLGFPPSTDLNNQVNGRVREGIAYATYDPPVVLPPGVPVPLVRYKAMAYSGATIDTSDGAARAVLAGVQVVEENSFHYRVLVGGVDVTYWRGTHTPRPTYSYVEPLLYGPGSLTLPQVVLPFEVPGRGSLAFLAKGSPVRVQRVNPATGLVVGKDLYRGLIVKHNMSGRVFSADLGGEASGRAGMRDFPVPLFQRRNDLGFWAYAAICDLGLSFMPHLGPDTGLVSFNWGGTNYLDYINEVCARAVARSGAQWTIMPGAGGHYRFAQKDTDTRHCTIYLDDSLAVASFTTDMAEEPNEVYASGSTVAGERVKFGVYPGLIQADPPPYPMDDDSPFGTGTEDADTDSGDGVTVMLWKLTSMGYLDLADRTGDYDNAAAAAVRRLQRDTADGPTFVNGIMDPDTWAALFDLDVTGYDLSWSHIEPAAQWNSTRKYRRSASGSVIALNPGYDRSVPRVSTTIDVGPGWKNRGQIKDFAQGELHPEGENHIVGTITLNGRGIILGEHNPGDPLTGANTTTSDVIQAGWNAWLPLWDGGVQVHISAVEFSSTGVPTLTVDTRARDARKVWEVIRRNRDSRVNLSRAWLAQHKSSAVAKDTITEYDEVGGKISDRVAADGHAWKVFPVVMGRSGSAARLLLRTNPPTEFVTAILGREVTPAWLSHLVANPLTKAGTKKWTSDAVLDALDSEVLLYVAGDHENPCGYWPRTKVVEDTTEGDNPEGDGDDSETDDNEDGEPVRHNPLTGNWRDDAGFDYRTFGAPVLWVAVYPRNDTVIRPGRVLWPNLDAGS